MRLFFILFFSLFLVYCAPGPHLPSEKPRAINNIENHAIHVPRDKEKSIKTLAGYLTSPAKNDSEKVKAIFTWITHNIRYDSRIHKVSRFGNNGSSSILKTKKAVCRGYSNLFYSLCKEAGLTVVDIDGYAKGNGYQIGDRFSGTPNHSWNAVNIQGVWHLVDPTWGAGYINEKLEYIHQRNDYYLFPPAQELVYTHFPIDSTWQLTDNPISLLEFENKIFVRDIFFKNKLKLKNPAIHTISVNNAANIELAIPEDVQIYACVLQNNETAKNAILKENRVANFYSAHITFTQPGEYLYKLFTNLPFNNIRFKLALSLKIIYNQE